MIIIRIEHENGMGVFQNETYFDFVNLFSRHRNMKTAPCIKGYTSSHYCGYKTIKEMEKWLRISEIRRLLKKGYKVYAIELKERFLDKEINSFKKAYIVDADQVIFLKKGIKKRTDISYLFEKFSEK